jgi:hypothetical protein
MKDALRVFVRAALWGSLAGSGPFLIFTVPEALLAPDWTDLEVWGLAVMPLAITAIVVVLAATVLGLPLTAWLSRQGHEDAKTYAVAGLGVGVLLPMILILARFGNGVLGAVLALPGAFAGAVTGTIWGRWRERASQALAQA